MKREHRRGVEGTQVKMQLDGIRAKKEHTPIHSFPSHHIQQTKTKQTSPNNQRTKKKKERKIEDEQEQLGYESRKPGRGACEHMYARVYDYS